MQTPLDVLTQDLQTASTKVSGYASDYRIAYRAIIAAADDIARDWEGDDFTAFKQQIHELEDDFERLYDLLMGCSNDLKESSDRYNAARSSNVSRARSLQTSFG